MARSLSHKGLLNIQFVVHDGEVRVLEVNPRASRTVPIVSKVTGVPIIEWATRVQLGESLADFAPTGLLPPPPIVAVKAPVFSAAKLPGVDPVLGPNMKSTGEVLGMGPTPEIAMKKVLPFAVGVPLPALDSHTRVFLSVSDVKKNELGFLVRELSAKGVSLYGTPGTAHYIQHQWGIEVKSLTEEEWTEWLKSDGDKVVVNVATRGNDPKRAGYRLRQACLAWQVPCFTSLETFCWYVRIAEEPTPVEHALVPIFATGWKEVVQL
jgi:carbamoyl-phosphate synthase large subunit